MSFKQDHYQFGLSILTSLLLISSGAMAGNIGTTFSPGDALTATQMNEIKDAVNDNDTNIADIQNAVNDNDSVIARLFAGDGSAGDLTVSDSLDWVTTPPSNPYFNNITIDAEQTLTVPAGTTIRCRGDFINNGTLAVAPNMNGGSHTSITNGISPVTTARISAPHPGDSTRAASPPASTFNVSARPFLPGGQGGSGIPRTRAITSYNLLQYGGGGGSGHLKGSTDGNGGDGGGLVKIQCNGTITNNGLIDADASTTVSGGGGGGGIVVLASLTEIINGATATITANGGAGEAAGSDHGNAGGGGGGIIVIIAPSFPDLTGTTSVLGGSADNVPMSGFLTASSGGGGGGASGGDGGAGGSLSLGGSTPTGFDGFPGYVIQIDAIPLPY